MEDNKELVTDVTENVEQATEELVDGAMVEEVEQPTETPEEKLYSESELNERLDKLLAEKLGKKTAIIERKLRREYDSKYGDLENVLKAGTGEEDLKAITNTFSDFYTKKGINIPQRTYNENDLKILASAEADEIISSGFDDVVEEVDRLADKGLDKMNQREKIVFQRLATYRQEKERENELLSIGAKDVLNNTEFNNFASQFNTNVPIKEVYNMWTKTQPKPKVEQMGSMKNVSPNKVKEYYSEEEISKLTLDDLNDPNVWRAVRNSMTNKK